MALDKPQVTQMLRTYPHPRVRRARHPAAGGRKIYGAVHPMSGQEAVAVGVCSSLTVSDPSHQHASRPTGICIAKGRTSGA